MEEIRLIDIEKAILSENKGLADKLRERLRKNMEFVLNIMGSSGVGIICTGAGE